MRQMFSGYYRPTDQELEALWKRCLFVLDSNVLLNMYRYPEEARQDLLRVLRSTSERIWIPHQVALEYQVNRTRVIADQVEKYAEVRKILKKVKSNLRGELGKLQLEKRHSSIDPSDLLDQIDKVFSRFEGELEKLKENHPDVHNDDILRDQIDTLFDEKVGSPPASQEYLDKLYSEGEARYKDKRPPGYMDIGKAQNNDAETYFFGDLTIRSEYGDLILWKQILEEAHRRDQLEHLIFVTDDEKEDWWWIVESGGPKRLGPRPELAEEIASKSGIVHFHMYNSDRFLALAEQYLKIQVKKESVDQVRDVVKLAEAERRSSPYETAGSTALKNMRDWLGEKLRDGPTLVNIQEIESKAPDWGLTPLDAALTFKDLRGDLWEGELITIEEHPAGYAAAWVERVH